jgi:hypothetical protein
VDKVEPTRSTAELSGSIMRPVHQHVRHTAIFPAGILFLNEFALAPAAARERLVPEVSTTGSGPPSRITDHTPQPNILSGVEFAIESWRHVKQPHNWQIDGPDDGIRAPGHFKKQQHKANKVGHSTAPHKDTASFHGESVD